MKIFPKHASTNAPHLTRGLSVLAAASLFLSDPVVTPGMSTGGASRRGWIADASLSRYATNSGKAWETCQRIGEDEGEHNVGKYVRTRSIKTTFSVHTAVTIAQMHAKVFNAERFSMQTTVYPVKVKSP